MHSIPLCSANNDKSQAVLQLGFYCFDFLRKEWFLSIWMKQIILVKQISNQIIIIPRSVGKSQPIQHWRSNGHRLSAHFMEGLAQGFVHAPKQGRNGGRLRIQQKV